MVSIIIPTVNRAASLLKTLESINALKTGRASFEVIVVDNGSTDNTKEIVNDFSRTADLDLHYVFAPEPGLLTGRHVGLQLAKGDVLTFIDDDVRVSGSWLNAILEVMQNRPDIDLLTGPNLPEYESHPPEWLSHFWTNDFNGKHCGWLSLLDFGPEEKEIDPVFVWGLNFTIRRDTLLELRGFHPDNMPEKLQKYQGDGETGLSLKAKKKHKKALYNPEVKLFHAVPASRMTDSYFEKRAFYQGVANSFTALRSEEEEVTQHVGLAKKIKRKLRKIVFQNKQNNLPLDIRKKREDLDRKEQEGFVFHQRLFSENEKVRNWVLKADYLDYKLPE
ncbi:MAG: glycosyl transferase family 2 [Crocinitomicaceae bacterium]|jgi:glycosyltransferase involved in cell wall biosynthesis|nr:glycosyl transferase family 2 [Crocinitomicaceae bacterium]